MPSEGVNDIDHNDFFDAVDMADLASDFHCLATCISCAISDNVKLGILEFFVSDAAPFVCVNSSTGHICNDITIFEDGLWSSGISLVTASSTSSGLQCGMIRLSLTDNEGALHWLELVDCLFVPDSPVNILSTRHLSENYANSDGKPDKILIFFPASQATHYFGMEANFSALSRHQHQAYQNLFLMKVLWHFPSILLQSCRRHSRHQSTHQKYACPLP